MNKNTDVELVFYLIIISTQYWKNNISSRLTQEVTLQTTDQRFQFSLGHEKNKYRDSLIG